MMRSPHGSVLFWELGKEGRGRYSPLEPACVETSADRGSAPTLLGEGCDPPASSTLSPFKGGLTTPKSPHCSAGISLGKMRGTFFVPLQSFYTEFTLF